MSTPLQALDHADPDLPAGPFPVPIDAQGLPIPRMRVWPADGGPPYEVQAYGCDIILYEETAAKHRWERLGPGDAPLRWSYFVAWAASRREHLIDPDVTWETFKTTTRMVADVDADARARPTPPGPGPG